MTIEYIESSVQEISRTKDIRLEVALYRALLAEIALDNLTHYRAVKFSNAALRAALVRTR